MKGRFAPSPTGYMHLGNLWIALLSFLSVRRQKGDWLIRMEDIDTHRSRRELGEYMLDELEWLGFVWEEGPRVGGPAGSYWQSERYDRYEEILSRLKEKGLVYPCYCRRARLQQIASAPHAGELPALYDGACRELTEEEQAELSCHKEPSWRLRLMNQAISFSDLWQGQQSFTLKAGQDDFVLRRADGMYAYNLAVVADDAAMGVTEVIRGLDLLPVTPLQLSLLQLLSWIDPAYAGAEAPVYGHAPLLVDEEGYRLSKRQKSITIRELKAEGFSAGQILGRLALLGGLIDQSQLEAGKAISLEKLVKEARWPVQFNSRQFTLTKLTSKI